jgi:hypothetical protein
MSFGLAACQTSNGTLFSIPELYELIVRLDFAGASGSVKFNDQTGVRDSTYAELDLANLVFFYNASAEYEAFNYTHGDFAAKIVPKISIQSFTGKIAQQEKLLLPFWATAPPRPKVLSEVVYIDLVPVDSVGEWRLLGPRWTYSLFVAWIRWADVGESQPSENQSKSTDLCCPSLCGTSLLVNLSPLLNSFQYHYTQEIYLGNKKASPCGCMSKCITFYKGTATY